MWNKANLSANVLINGRALDVKGWPPTGAIHTSRKCVKLDDWIITITIVNSDVHMHKVNVRAWMPV